MFNRLVQLNCAKYLLKKFREKELEVVALKFHVSTLESQVNNLQNTISDKPRNSFQTTIERKLFALKARGEPAKFKIILYWPTSQIFDDEGINVTQTVSDYYHFDGGKIRLQLTNYSYVAFKKYGILLKAEGRIVWHCNHSSNKVIQC